MISRIQSWLLFEMVSGGVHNNGNIFTRPTEDHFSRKPTKLVALRKEAGHK